MARTVPLERLGVEIEKILEEYSDEVTEDIKDTVEKVTKAGARTVNQNARSSMDGTGRYARGWRGQVEKTRFTAEGVIYNASLPGLPHLLENGHAKRGGGRTRAIVHIKPVEEKLAKEFEQKVRAAIT